LSYFGVVGLAYAIIFLKPFSPLSGFIHEAILRECWRRQDESK
jgi:hypothetical protein